MRGGDADDAAGPGGITGPDGVADSDGVDGSGGMTGPDGASDPHGMADTDDVLASLVDKSLVEVAGGRYRMLETIRAFCAGQLAAAGEAERLRRAHADHFLALALRAGPYLLGAEQLEWLARLDAERDNLHAALRRTVEDADVERALRLLAALMPYWWLRGLRSEGAALARELARLVGTRVPAGLEEEYAVCVLSIASSGSRAEFDDHLRVAVDAVLAAGRPPRQPFVTMLWGMAMGVPDVDSLNPVTDHRFLVGSDPWSQALGHVGDGLVLLYGGQVGDAERELSTALDGFRAAGERWGLSVAHAELARIAEMRGDFGRALALVDESIAASRELGADDDVAERLCLRASLRACTGDDEGARRDGEHAMEIARGAGRRTRSPRRGASWAVWPGPGAISPRRVDGWRRLWRRVRRAGSGSRRPALSS
nr:hypothetical protein GCM10020093_047080 [Planobispora longispora]